MNKGFFIGILAVLALFCMGCGPSEPAQAANSAVQATVDKSSQGSNAQYAKDALHKAAYDGNEKRVREILQTKPDPDARDSSGGTALHAAMFQKNIKIVTLLLDYGLDINAIGPKNGYTPLHDAVWANNTEAIRLLLSRGADPTIRNHEGLTPMEKAEQEGKTALVQIFKEKASQ